MMSMTTARTIKVRIPVTVEIDMDAWCTDYATETAAEVREDVKRHIAESVHQHFDSLGVLA